MIIWTEAELKKYFKQILCFLGFHNKKFVEDRWQENKKLYICHRCYLQWTEPYTDKERKVGCSPHNEKTKLPEYVWRVFG